MGSGVPQLRIPAAAAARLSLPASCARPPCRKSPMGTLRDLDLDEAGDHPAPQRRPAIFFMIHQYLLFLSFDAGGARIFYKSSHFVQMGTPSKFYMELSLVQ